MLDADVYGPNVPLMMGTQETPHGVAERKLRPVQSHGVKMISMGLLILATSRWSGAARCFTA